MDPFEGQFDFSKLSDSDKRELRRFIDQETQKTMVQKTIHGFTDICWKKCITSRISSGKLDRTEEACAQNCVDRFLDTNMAVLRHLEAMRGDGTV